jgi:gamma-glutamyltranspeptidase/glutathione hydrolase
MSGRAFSFGDRRVLSVLGALGFILAVAACRPVEIQAPASPPADRHAPFNFEATNGMVVAAHPLAAEAGRDMLKRGGNAVDAAVATAFALNAAEPFASGIGGGGFMVIYLAKEKKVTVINYREKAPASATPSMFAGKGETTEEWRLEKGTAVGVPGMLAGWNMALAKYGTKSLADCAARAIEIAERGFAVSATFSTINKDEYERILKNAGETTVYLNQGIPYEPGETFRNPDLARTLRLIGEKGIGEFYKGTIARKIVEAVQAKGGGMTLEDLASYDAKEVAPLKGTYKDCTIYTLPPPASGGMHVLQLLQILESWPLKSWGPNSAVYIHHLSEAMRYLFADHDRYFGDPDFVKIPMSELLSREYARAVAAKIKPDKTAASYPYATFDAAENRTGNTTHLGVVDKDGNAVALTQSINDFFATAIVPDRTGFLLNNHMRDFDIDPKSPNAPGPGRRPVSNMGPMIVFKGGSPFLILGSPGGTRIFPSLAQILANILDFGMDLDTAIEAPRFFSYSTDGKPRPISVESRIPAGIQKALEALGHKIQIKEDYDKYFGGAQALMILRNPRKILGGADSRRDGVGAGY